MASIKKYKSTALTIAVLAIVFIFGVGLVVDPDSSVGERIVGVALLVAGAAAAVGLRSLATKRLTVGAAQTLIAAGLIAAGAFAISAMLEDFDFFVWVFGPVLVLAVLALWLGVVNGGLKTELAG
jgi:drug/metabolite transporter (DMT)-like permease